MKRLSFAFMALALLAGPALAQTPGEVRHEELLNTVKNAMMRVKLIMKSAKHIVKNVMRVTKNIRSIVKNAMKNTTIPNSLG